MKCEQWGQEILTSRSPQMNHRIVFALSSPEGVDREAGIIHGLQVMAIGPLNDDRPWIVDDTTLAQLEGFGNQTKQGVRSRLSHPGGDDLSLRLGFVRNFRRTGEVTRADLHFSKAASKSPAGDLAEFAMTLIEESPGDLGASIVPTGIMLAEPTADGLHPIRLKGLKAVDLVGDPAATSGTFEIEAPEPEPEPEPDEPVEDIQVTEPTTTPEPGTIDPVQLQRFSELFGKQAVRYLLEGKSMEACLLIERESFTQRIAELTARNAELETKLVQLRALAGEQLAAEFSERQQAEKGPLIRFATPQN